MRTERAAAQHRTEIFLMADVAFVVLTVVCFALLVLALKGAQRL